MRKILQLLAYECLDSGTCECMLYGVHSFKYSYSTYTYIFRCQNKSHSTTLYEYQGKQCYEKISPRKNISLCTNTCLHVRIIKVSNISSENEDRKNIDGIKNIGGRDQAKPTAVKMPDFQNFYD